MHLTVRLVALYAVGFIGALGAHLLLLRWVVLASTTPEHRRIRRWATGVLAVLGVGLSSVRFLTALLPSWAARPYSVLAWGWLGAVLYVVLGLGTIKGVAGLVRKVSRRTPDEKAPVADTSRRVILARAMSGVVCAATGVAFVRGFSRAFEPPNITDVPVRLPGLPRALDGLTIAHLSDLHIGGILESRFLSDVVSRVNRLSPDLVAITGDLVDGSVAHLGSTVAVVNALKSRFGTYFVTGNHDFYSGDEDWCRTLEQLGLTVLRNRTIAVGDAGGRLDLIGVDDWSAAERGYDFKQASSGRDPDRPSVLLAHQPKGFAEAAAAGVGLQLSGHTHGGQFFPGTALVDLAWKYPGGVYGLGDSHLVVSRGTGFWGPPLRLGTHSEIIRVTLLAG